MKAVWLAAIAIAPIFATPIHVKLDPNQTTVGFTLADVLHVVHGTFKLTQGEIWIDPANGKAGGQMTVSAASGDSGSHARDSRMTKNVLQATLFPDITFRPDRMEGTVNRVGDSSFQLHGSFGIHGASHELTMAVKCHIESDRVTANASFDVPYESWGMKNPSTLFLRVADTVKIEIFAVGNTESRAESDLLLPR